MKSSIIKIALLPLILLVNYLSREKPYRRVLYAASMAYLVGDIIYTLGKLIKAEKKEKGEDVSTAVQ